MIVTLEHRDSITSHQHVDALVVNYGGRIYRLSDRDGKLVVTTTSDYLVLRVLCNAIELGEEDRR